MFSNYNSSKEFFTLLISAFVGRIYFSAFPLFSTFSPSVVDNLSPLFT